MWWAAAIQGGMAFIGAGKAKRAGRQARRIANLNADLEEEETGESVRRMIASNKSRVGYARAVAGASGFSIQKGTSQQRYIDELDAEGKRQVRFASKAGRSRAKIIRMGGQLLYQQGKAQAWGQVGQGIGFAGKAKSLWGKG